MAIMSMLGQVASPLGGWISRVGVQGEANRTKGSEQVIGGIKC